MIHSRYLLDTHQINDHSGIAVFGVAFFSLFANRGLYYSRIYWHMWTSEWEHFRDTAGHIILIYMIEVVGCGLQAWSADWERQS